MFNNISLLCYQELCLRASTLGLDYLYIFMHSGNGERSSSLARTFVTSETNDRPCCRTVDARLKCLK